MVSFQHRLAAGLSARGLEVCFDLADHPYGAVLVIGGTRQLAGLWRARRKGIPIVQRLDGMNWLHKRRCPGKAGSSLRLYLRSEYGNRLLVLIRSRLASRIVYQSQFVRGWWERDHGASPSPSVVIYNAADLAVFSPHGSGNPPADHCRLLLVEGSLTGGYELGLEFAVDLAEYLGQLQLPFPSRQIELVIVGRVSPENKQRWERKMQNEAGEGRVWLSWFGVARREQIPEIDRSAHLLYSADINSACPNSVIEALACGLPVVAFDTGALSELVTVESGRVVPYGGDPWCLEPPDIEGLAAAASEILHQRDRFRKGARQRAEQAFDMDRMVEAYITTLLEG